MVYDFLDPFPSFDRDQTWNEQTKFEKVGCRRRDPMSSNGSRLCTVAALVGCSLALVACGKDTPRAPSAASNVTVLEHEFTIPDFF